MTGPEHYQKAEDLINELLDKSLPPDVVMAWLARAQVHATLALTAAWAPNHSDWRAAGAFR